MPAAGKDAPFHFRSIDDTYKWADIFLKRIARVYGSQWLCQQLMSWKWSMSTSFSGVGCAESVQSLVLLLLHMLAKAEK